MNDAKLVALDTMNYWIDTVPDAVMHAISGVHAVIINDAEARQLSGEPNLIRAAHKILDAGPQSLVIKRGEYGRRCSPKTLTSPSPPTRSNRS